MTGEIIKIGRITIPGSSAGKITRWRKICYVCPASRQALVFLFGGGTIISVWELFRYLIQTRTIGRWDDWFVCCYLQSFLKPGTRQQGRPFVGLPVSDKNKFPDLSDAISTFSSSNLVFFCTLNVDDWISRELTHSTIPSWIHRCEKQFRCGWHWNSENREVR